MLIQSENAACSSCRTEWVVPSLDASDVPLMVSTFSLLVTDLLNVVETSLDLRSSQIFSNSFIDSRPWPRSMRSTISRTLQAGRRKLHLDSASYNLNANILEIIGLRSIFMHQYGFITKADILNLPTCKSPNASPPATELSDPFSWPLVLFPFVEWLESCNWKCWCFISIW